MHLNQGNWERERERREEDEISFWLVLENLIFKSIPSFGYISVLKLLLLQDIQTPRLPGNERCRMLEIQRIELAIAWLQYALLSFPSNCATVFPLHLVKLLGVFSNYVLCHLAEDQF